MQARVWLLQLASPSLDNASLGVRLLPLCNVPFREMSLDHVEDVKYQSLHTSQGREAERPVDNVVKDLGTFEIPSNP